jgi:hypothetical protein
MKPLGKVSCHNDETSYLSFHPTNKNIWLTCGLDELLNQCNMEDPDTLEFSITFIICIALRSEQPLIFCGFYGRDLDKQFAVTGSHNLELYDTAGNINALPRNIVTLH